MKEIILLKAGEIALKGLNRSTFEDRLVKNCKFRTPRCRQASSSTRAQSTMYAEPLSEEIDMDDAVETLQHIFGFCQAEPCLCGGKGDGHHLRRRRGISGKRTAEDPHF